MPKSALDRVASVRAVSKRMVAVMVLVAPIAGAPAKTSSKKAIKINALENMACPAFVAALGVPRVIPLPSTLIIPQIPQYSQETINIAVHKRGEYGYFQVNALIEKASQTTQMIVSQKN